MLFLNISADKIHCIADGTESFIEHGDLEKTIADFLYQQKNITKVFVLNGPGSFTNIRIATLALNMYNFLHNGKAEYYSIDKLSLYKKLYQRDILPRLGYIFIGQRKNRRKIDLESMHHEMVQEFDDNDAFIDQVFDQEREGEMIALAWEDEKLVVTYKWSKYVLSLAELDVKPTKTLEANYMMEPNVTIKEFK